MKVYVYGNSLIRSINLTGYAETVVIPGANCDELLDAALNRHEIRDCILYIIEGPIRYTKLVKTNRRREMLPKPIIPEIENHLNHMRSRCVGRNISLVFPTMSALHYGIYNNYYASRKNLRTTMRSFYAEYQYHFCEQIKKDNGKIVGNNRSHHIYTPFLNKGTILHGRKFSYGRRKLYDGLHPHYKIRRVWEKELKKNIDLNIARMRFESRFQYGTRSY